MAKSAFVIIDMVYDFVDPKGLVYYPYNQKILPRIKECLDKARKNDLLVIFAEHQYRENKYDKNLVTMRPCCIAGSGGEKTVSQLKVDLKRDYVIAKRRYSAFYGTDLDLILRENKIENIILVGTKTNNCILATALDGYYRDYNVYVIKECCATSDMLINEVYLNDINKYIGKAISVEKYDELLEEGQL